MILGIDRTVPLLSSVEVDETKQVLSTTKDDRSSHLIAIDNVCPIVPPSYKEVRIFGLPVSVDFFCVTVIIYNILKFCYLLFDFILLYIAFLWQCLICYLFTKC